MSVEKLSGVTLFVYFGLASFAVAIAPASPTVSSDGLYCSDRYGYRIQDGVEYMPEDDPCKKCQCQSGYPVMCQSVLCSPPTCTMFESLKNECCEFRCIQPSQDMPRNSGNGTSHIYPMLKDANSVNLSIRLVASAVTSLLIFALLIFMIHRLRQRRLLISMRRLNNDRRSTNDGLAYMTNIDQLDIGFEFPPYEDPPPPYSLPKPNDVPTEAPPPYELTSSLLETEPSEIINTETDGLNVRSSIREVIDELPRSISAAVAVKVLGNNGLMNNNSLRPFSALEPFQPQLNELSQLNPDTKSAITLSSPLLTGQKRNQRDSRCQSNRLTTNRKSGELLNVAQCSTDSMTPAPNQVSVNLALKHPACHQIKFDSSTSQMLVKMLSKLAHSSLLKAAIKASGCSSNITADKMESQSEQHLNLQTNFIQEFPSSEGSTKNLYGFPTIYDHSDLPNLVSVESEVEDDPNKARVKHFCTSNWDSNLAERGENLMQKSAPKVSLYMNSTPVLCTDSSREKRLLNLPKIRNKSKSKPCLRNSSFLRKHKQKYPSQLQSCSEAVFESSSNKSSLEFMRRSVQPSTIQMKAHLQHNRASLLVQMGHADSSSFCFDSKTAKTQMLINQSATTFDDWNSKGTLQPLFSNDQSHFVTTTKTEGLNANKPVVEDTLMVFPCQSSQSPVGLPLQAHGKKIDSSCNAFEKTWTGDCVPKDTVSNTSSTISTSMVNSHFPVQDYQNYCLSGSNFTQKQSNRNQCYPSSTKIKNAKRSVNNPNTLQVKIFEALSFSSSKYVNSFLIKDFRI